MYVCLCEGVGVKGLTEEISFREISNILGKIRVGDKRR